MATTATQSPADVATELISAVNMYASDVTGRRTSTHAETNRVRLLGLIRSIHLDPDSLESNLDELFNRVTMAALDTKSA